MRVTEMNRLGLFALLMMCMLTLSCSPAAEPPVRVIVVGIDAAEDHHAEMEQYRIVQPEETQTLRAAIGKVVEVKLDNGAVLVGQIAAVSSSTLVLDIEDDVGGGVVKFTDEVPLSTVRWIKIWAD